jgi:hypothetical protein
MFRMLAVFDLQKSSRLEFVGYQINTLSFLLISN